jgi:hypothetical protein
MTQNDNCAFRQRMNQGRRAIQLAAIGRNFRQYDLRFEDAGERDARFRIARVTDDVDIRLQLQGHPEGSADSAISFNEHQADWGGRTDAQLVVAAEPKSFTG